MSTHSVSLRTEPECMGAQNAVSSVDADGSAMSCTPGYRVGPCGVGWNVGPCYDRSMRSSIPVTSVHDFFPHTVLPSSTTDLSIAIVSYNTRAVLLDCIHSSMPMRQASASR